jgi:hypothetical protein
MRLPHIWITQALGAREVAEHLWAGHHEPRSEQEYELYVTMGSAFYTPALFFAGIELELYLKSMIICGIELNAEEQEWTTKIFKLSHKLNELCNVAGVALSKKERGTCGKLSAYIAWMGRYPIPKK